MTASPPSPRERLLAVLTTWLDDPDADVVAVEEVEGRVAVRLRQIVRDFSTVWIDVGERTARFELYVLPAPPRSAPEVHRQALARNRSMRDVAFALDRDGAVVLVARIPVTDVTEARLQSVFGELWEGVELAFPSMVRLAFAREKSP